MPTSNRASGEGTAYVSSGRGAKRRFPEFMGQPLHHVRLRDLTEECTARNGSRLSSETVMGVKKEDGIVPMEERLIAADLSRYKLVRNNWFAYNPMRLNIGSIARWQRDSDVLVSPDYVVFRCLERTFPTTLLPEYFDNFRASRQWAAFVSEAGDGGVRVRIYYRDIAQFHLTLPDVDEQQRIADCLGSLDDLIAAEGRKLDALREHKQGLMQQLFPQPGETVPRLRFPEFQRAGDWKRDQLGNVARITKGKGVSKADITKSGATPCIRYAELYTHYREVIHEVVSRTNVPHEDLMLSQAEDVIVPASGETRVDIARAACVLPERVALGSDLNILRSNLHGPFFSYLLNSPLRHTIARMAQGDTVAHLYPGQLSQVWLAYPLRLEQQKIADSLGSLDDLIAAEGRKLDALRQHKQGLLQQLFPR